MKSLFVVAKKFAIYIIGGAAAVGFGVSSLVETPSINVSSGEGQYIKVSTNKPLTDYFAGDTFEMLIHPKQESLPPGQRLALDMFGDISYLRPLQRVGGAWSSSGPLTMAGAMTVYIRVYREDTKQAEAIESELKILRERLVAIERQYRDLGLPMPPDVENEYNRMGLAESSLLARRDSERTYLEQVLLGVTVTWPEPKVYFVGKRKTVLEGSGPRSILVRMSNQYDTNISVPYTVSGSASNHNLVSGTLVFTPGMTETMIEYQADDDNVFDGDEILEVELQTPNISSIIEPSKYTVTIQDNTLPNIIPRTLSDGSPSYMEFTLGIPNIESTVAAIEWEFGDGAATFVQPIEEYVASGGIRHLYRWESYYYLRVTPIHMNGGRMRTAERYIQTSSNKRPVPKIVPNVILGRNINFNATGSTDSDGSIVSYHWDFGDGHTSTNANISHDYFYTTPEQLVEKTVVLTVTDDDGATAQTSVRVYLGNPNWSVIQPGPSVVIQTSPVYGLVGSEFTFDASNSFHSTGVGIKAIYWTSGDIQYDPIRPGSVAKFRYATAGVYRPSVTVIANDDSQSTTFFEIFVADNTGMPLGTDIIGKLEGFPWAQTMRFDTSPISMRGLVDPKFMYWKVGENPNLLVGKDVNESMPEKPYDLSVENRALDIFGNRLVTNRTISVGATDSVPMPSFVLDRDWSFFGNAIAFNAAASSGVIPETQIKWTISDENGYSLEDSFAAASYFPVSIGAPAGAKSAWMRLENPNGLGASTVRSFRALSNLPPIAEATLSGPRVGTSPMTRTFNASPSFGQGGTIVDYYWSNGTGPLASYTDVSATSTFTRSFTGYFSGSRDSVFLTVRDENGNVSATRRERVFVIPAANLPGSNMPPTAIFGWSFPNSDGYIEFDTTMSVDDHGVVVQEWDFGDGTTGNFFPDEVKSHEYASPGTYAVTLKVFDAHGATATWGTNVVVPPFLKLDLGQNIINQDLIDQAKQISERMKFLREEALKPSGCVKESGVYKCRNHAWENLLGGIQ